MGEGPLLLPEQSVILSDSADEAHSIGTDWLRAYLALPNYANNLLRSGFSEDDLTQVSDRLFEQAVPQHRVHMGLAAVDQPDLMPALGQYTADGAASQALTADPTAFPREQWRRIAAAVG